MKKPIFQLLQIVVAGLMLTAASCDPANHAWYNVFGQYCYTGHPSPGCTYYSDGHKISAWEDPHFNSSYHETNSVWTYINPFSGRTEWYWGWGWRSPDGILYDQDGRALNSTESQDESRDLIANAAAEEEKVLKEAGLGFAHEHALTEATGMHVARTLNAWAKLPRSRARTDQDLSDFSKRLFGVSADRIRGVLDSQDDLALAAVNAEVASYWGTTPETTATVLKAWYRDEVSGR